MRNTLTLLAIIAITTIIGCGKADNGANVNPQVLEVKDSSYIVNGIQDFNINNFEEKSYSFDVQFVVTQAEQEKITFTVEGLPEGVSATFTNNGAIPSFKTDLKFYASLVKGGTYPIKIVGTSTSGKIKRYEVNLVINGVNCVDFIATKSGPFTIKDDKGNIIDYHKMRLEWGTTLFPVTRHSSTEVVYSNSVWRNPFAPSGVKVIYNCDDYTFVIPDNTITFYEFGDKSREESYDIKGSGKFDRDKIEMTYTTTSSKYGTFTYTCVAPLYL